MKAAPKKCEYIKFNAARKYANSNVMNPKLNQALIHPVENVRDLGIYFSSNLSFHYHYSMIIRKSHQRINMLFSILKNSSWRIFIKCYSIYIRPLLEYGTIVTSPILKDHIIKLESVQKSFVFRIFKKFRMTYTSYFEALEECQLSSLEYRRLYNDLVYTYKIIVSKESIMEVPIFEIFNHAGSLRRHKYYLKSLMKNSTKISSQFLSNRVIRCWNSLPAVVFPVKPSSAAFKNRLLSCDLNHFLVLNSTNY
ncbi:unnamed protein product [Caenorhabditis nigoni]